MTVTPTLYSGSLSFVTPEQAVNIIDGVSGRFALQSTGEKLSLQHTSFQFQGGQSAPHGPYFHLQLPGQELIDGGLVQALLLFTGFTDVMDFRGTGYVPPTPLLLSLEADSAGFWLDDFRLYYPPFIEVPDDVKNARTLQDQCLRPLAEMTGHQERLKDFLEEIVRQ